MTYKSSTRNVQVKKMKALFGLTGDVYVINDHLIESLASHKRMYPDSVATTIEEAEQERLVKMQEEAERLKELNEDLHSENEA